MLHRCNIKAPNGALGLNLTRAPWDPYPWVSGVQAESNAQMGGICIGDTLLQLNGTDVLGMRISELATNLREHWLTGAEHVTMMMWRQQPSDLILTDDPKEAAHAVHHGINQQSLQKFATCLQNIAQLLECPVCCDVIKPPSWQCCNGHVLCNNCRNRSEKCPVCRVPLGPRGRCLLSDKLFTLLTENFPCAGDNLDVFDIVAASDGPSLQSFRNNSLDELYNSKVLQAVELHSTPVALLRRVSETVTHSILSDLEPETQHLLGKTPVLPKNDAQKRPQPPPRSYMKGQQHNFADGTEAGKNIKQLLKLQLKNTLAHSDDMTQCGNTAGNPAMPLHTKLDIHNFSEDHNNGLSEVVSESIGEVTQNAATLILTPTSLNLTNTTPNARSSGANNNSSERRANADNGRGYHANGEHYKGPKWWRHLVLHWSLVSEHVALLMIFVALWTLALVLLPEYAAPDTAIMRIILLFVGAQISGILVTFIHLPDMLGMLFFGVLYTNVGLANFEGYARLELFLRELALINIMLLAGLGLDGSAFRRLWLMILRLTLVPTIVEVTVIAVLAYFALSMPWMWGIALGLVITAVSPNVVVTVMLKLKEDRLGLNSGIHTLIYAMTTCNDVVAIFLFGVVISIIFSSSSLTQKVLQGPIGIGIGLVFGYLYGMMLHYLPSRNAVYVNGLRFVLTILGGTIAVMGSRIIGYTSAGALGCVMLAFIAGIGWKREELKMTPEQIQAQKVASVPKRLDLLWKFLKPVSFALIGKEINFAVLEGRVIGYGALLVLLGSLFRLAFAYLSTYGGNLSRRERAYITISGFPKATVQAALGPVALDLARSSNLASELALASNVLIISVLAIIFTAPLGAILMLRLAPFWLKHGDTVDTAETPTTPVSAVPCTVNNVGELNSPNTPKNIQ